MRHICLTAVLLVMFHSSASSQVIPPAPVLVLDHVGIQVVDLNRSVAFYTRVLGLREVAAPFPRTAARWIALGGGRMLHIVANGKADTLHNRWNHFALACANLYEMAVRLKMLHVAWTDMDGRNMIQTRPDHVRQIFVRDPDGYDVEINDARQ